MKKKGIYSPLHMEVIQLRTQAVILAGSGEGQGGGPGGSGPDAHETDFDFSEVDDIDVNKAFV